MNLEVSQQLRSNHHRLLIKKVMNTTYYLPINKNEAVLTEVLD